MACRQGSPARPYVALGEEATFHSQDGAIAGIKAGALGRDGHVQDFGNRLGAGAKAHRA